jgi:hypothetical protein
MDLRQAQPQSPPSPTPASPLTPLAVPPPPRTRGAAELDSPNQSPQSPCFSDDDGKPTTPEQRKAWSDAWHANNAFPR